MWLNIAAPLPVDLKVGESSRAALRWVPRLSSPQLAVRKESTPANTSAFPPAPLTTTSMDDFVNPSTAVPAQGRVHLSAPRLDGLKRLPHLVEDDAGLSARGEVLLVLLFVVAYGLSSAIVTVLCVRKARAKAQRRRLVDEGLNEKLRLS
ncbi:hypothetical protein PSEUBRA_003749 [Kalmanozyma brasiliensis GHG001]|uniref:uncharacterized protein n=1 Tax=Kalmanozyma brasiliensis (strain GHG001) TaxID=1365824 RepID=UPI001CE8AB26|nr:uncharacterized protein PSEUBRA_003749 [Kalmanozyma brasiliensis GHG001]KAF6767284.1 hypothetical protein PSEUBRA_003749 [Kalmanozyma brasiliensis GHG001]